VSELPAAVALLLRKGVAYLVERGVSEAEANAEFLMASVLGCGRGVVLASGSRELPWKSQRHYWELVKRRGRRVPLAYVLGTQPFAGLEFKVSPSVLIPRPETEELVERVLVLVRESFPGRGGPGRPPINIVELGTGSGCVAVALAKRLPDAVVCACEVSVPALRIAEENARLNGVERRIRFVHEDLFKTRNGSAPRWADVLVSNPPYVPTRELAGLEPEVRAEPVLALDGGRDGLDAIRAIAAEAPGTLRAGGWLVLEFGDGQADRVRGILRACGFADIDVKRDLQGRDRIVLGRLAK